MTDPRPPEPSPPAPAVQLHVQLQGAAARRLALHTHVCEVQLILVDFARIKVPTD